jgi:hypothetical protein
MSCRRGVRKRQLASRVLDAIIGVVDPPIEHHDVTTIMRMISDIQTDIHAIRRLLEDENGEAEEEDPEDHA